MSAISSTYDTLCQMRYLRRSYFHADLVFDLIGTDYFLRLDTNAKITWAKSQSWNRQPFEEVFNNSPKIIQEELLFHLDLFV